jgi:hypothetical protein
VVRSRVFVQVSDESCACAGFRASGVSLSGPAGCPSPASPASRAWWRVTSPHLAGPPAVAEQILVQH